MIAIFDGYTSSAELYLYLKQINDKTDIEILTHDFKIHGLEDEKIMKHLILSEPSLIIIPDASGNENQYEILHNLNYEILCIDHHITDDSEYAIVVNNQISPNVLNKQCSGAIVVHQMLRALDKELGVKYAQNYMDIAMLGNISDVMNMANYYNRTYNYYGFKNITNPFIKLLIENFINEELNPHNISFMIAPKFNASIRSENLQLKKDMFLALIGEIDCEEVIEKCAQCHEKQKRIVKQISDDMLPLLNKEDKVNIIQYDDMPKAFTGLIAGRISGITNKPAVIVKEINDKFMGSMRSSIPIRSIFNKCEAVDYCRGHEESSGIQLNDLEEFKKYCNKLNITKDNIVEITQSFDAKKIPKHLFTEFNGYDELWGSHIPKPSFHVYNIKINSNDIRVMGKNRTTIKFTYGNFDYIKFFVSHDDQDVVYCIGQNKELLIELVAEFGLNTFKGRVNKQCIFDKIEVNIIAKKAIDIDDIF